MMERYDDGLDEEVTATRAAPTAIRAHATRATPPTRAGTTTRAARPDDDDERPQSLIERLATAPIQWMTIPLFAAFVFAICGLLGFVLARVIARANIDMVLRAFAVEGGMSSSLFGVVPALFAMMFALFLYQNAERKITTVAQSLSRGILIALLTWLSFSALATWAWGPADYWGYFSSVLLVCGLIGGGPMLGGALLAGAIVGWLIKQRRLGWIMQD